MPKPDRAQFLDLEVKLGEPSDTGEFEGTASVFGEVDGYGDRVEPGAFRKSLASHKRNGRMPLLLWMHDQTAPIGRWLNIQETATGLAVKGKLVLDTVRGREAYTLLKERALDGLSIGFRTVKAARIKTGRLLQEVDLAEISLVALPALASARVTTVKSRGDAAHPSEGLFSMANEAEDGAVETDVTEQIDQRLGEMATEIKSAQDAAVTELKAKIDRIETRLARPNARVEVKEDTAELERKAFNTFARRGLDGMSDLERKILTASTIGSPSADGFTLVPETFLVELMRDLVEFSPMRSLARTQQVSGNPVKLPKRLNNLTSAWVAETVEHDLSQPAYGQQEIPIFEARVSVEISNQLLEDAAFNLSSELARDFAEEFGRLESAAFVDGDGVTQPDGFRDAIATSGDPITADEIINLYYAVPSVYAARGTWAMGRQSMAAVRKLKTSGTGVYLWTDSLQPGQPASLLGRPVVEFPEMDTATGSPSPPKVAFGDWNRGYRIFDRVGLEILRDPYTKARFSVVVFHARKRVGGAVVDAQALAGLMG
jgi:HK97 family phage major capsid protein/HK97 family phage prohead protease